MDIMESFKKFEKRSRKKGGPILERIKKDKKYLGGEQFEKEDTDILGQKLSESHKGRKMSAEHKAKIISSMKKYTFTDEHKKKISEARKGCIISEEQRRKISSTLKNRNMETK